MLKKTDDLVQEKVPLQGYHIYLSFASLFVADGQTDSLVKSCYKKNKKKMTISPQGGGGSLDVEESEISPHL